MHEQLKVEDSQLSSKDKQIEELHTLLDQAQKLQLSDKKPALIEEEDKQAKKKRLIQPIIQTIRACKQCSFFMKRIVRKFLMTSCTSLIHRATQTQQIVALFMCHIRI
ncbi:MAG: hypothetical protein ABF703_07270 [Oenococcus sp.]|nr:hypothetical protein [Oenococcus kitaharae]MCV3296038.1 hypothetical protein [Oenococcus kitaharae]